MIREDLLKKRRYINIIQSSIIIIGTALLLGLVSFVIFGMIGSAILLFVWFFTIFLIPKLKPFSVLKNYQARKLHHYETPNLYKLVYKLSKNAKLTNTPNIYYIPSNSFIAFSTGSKEDSVIALSDGVLRLLNYNELYGVLGHEISHIKNNDIWLMQLCDISSKLTTFISYLGQFFMILLAPFLLLNGFSTYFWSLFLLFLFIPPISILMELSLSRTREYGADLDAAYLTGDPNYLKDALLKIDNIEEGILSKLNPFKKSEEPSVLRTHPPISKRVEKLNELDIKNDSDLFYMKKDDMFKSSENIIVIKPRDNYKFWY